MLTDVQKKKPVPCDDTYPSYQSASSTYGMLRPILVFPQKFSRKAAIGPIVRKIRYMIDFNIEDKCFCLFPW